MAPLKLNVCRKPGVMAQRTIGRKNSRHASGILRNFAHNSRQVQVAYLKQFGSGSLSFSSLQSGLGIFLQPKCGYIAYADNSASTKPVAICLADPICSQKNKEAVLRGFLKKFSKPVFVHISEDTASTLAKMGFYVNEMGVETVVDLQRFSLAGGKKQFLRSQRNRAIKDGLTVLEGNSETINPEVIRNISEFWIKEKTVRTHELSFIVRPIVYDCEPGVRRFFAFKNGEPVGFVFFDPIYKDGRAIGYLANIVRSMQEQSYSICDFIILEAIEKFRQEGIAELSLGFSPFAYVNDDGSFLYSKPLQRLFKYLFSHGNHLYAFKLLAFHKDRYRPGEEGCYQKKVYCATTSVFPIVGMYFCFLKMGIDPLLQTISTIASGLKTLFALPKNVRT